MPPSQPTPTSVDQGAVLFYVKELSKHRGHWVTFSADGRRLIASCPTLSDLDAQVLAAGEDPEEVLLERVPESNSILYWSELS